MEPAARDHYRVVLVIGEAEEIGPAATGEEMARRLPNATFLSYPHLDHMAPFTHPARGGRPCRRRRHCDGLTATCQPIDTTSVTTSVPSSCVSTATLTRFSTKSSGSRQVLAVTPHDPQRQPRLFERRRRILDGVADHVRDIHRDGFLRCCVVRRVVVARTPRSRASLP